MRGAVIGLLLRARAALWTARRASRRRAVPLAIAIAAIEAVFLWWALVLSLSLVVAGAPIAALILLGLAAWLGLPHWLIDAVAVPRGWHRVAHALAWIDPRGDGARWQAVVAARAIARAGSPEPAVTWLTARLGGRLDGDAVVAHALVACGRGDRDDARRLLASVPELSPPASVARAVAGEWMAIDAAERGAWRALLDDAATWPPTPVRLVVEAVAARAVGAADAPSRAGLWLRWLLAPSRRATWALLRDPPVVAAAVETTHVVDEADPDLALVARRALGRARGLRRPADVTAAVEAWAAVIDDPAWAPALVARASGLGLDGEAAATTVAAASGRIVAELTALVLDTGAPLPSGEGALAAAVRTSARGQLLDRIELTCDRVRRRAAAEQWLAPIDEWRDFLALRASYQAAVAPGGVELERVAYPHVDDALGPLSVRLWNQRGEPVLSHAMIEWLYAGAVRVGDGAAIEHHGRNRALRVPA